MTITDWNTYQYGDIQQTQDSHGGEEPGLTTRPEKTSKTPSTATVRLFDFVKQHEEIEQEVT